MILLFFFFKQKTAYEMRISDWSSDVCSSDLSPSGRRISAACAISPREAARRGWKRTGGRRDGDGKSSPKRGGGPRAARRRGRAPNAPARSVRRAQASSRTDRKSVESGTGVSVRVDQGGRRRNKQKKTK